MQTVSKIKHKPFSVFKRNKEATELIRFEYVPKVTRSIHTDISKENTETNSIATQQCNPVVHQETDTDRKHYKESGIQSDDSASEETILPKSSNESNSDGKEFSIASSLCSVLTPKTSKNNTKTPEAGDKSTPQVSNQVTSQALVPFKEDTLQLLLHARSKLLNYVDEDGSAIGEKNDIVSEGEEVANLLLNIDEDLENGKSDRLSDQKVDTYNSMQTDIKEMISELLLQSSEIKDQALNAGILEDDTPPLICDFLDNYYSTASTDVAYILDFILKEVEEKTQKPVGIGDADEIKSTLKSFLLPTENKNVTETYFCTTTFDRIPKTSWIFGDTPKKSSFEDDILFPKLGGDLDLISGLLDSNEQFVCMVNSGMKKSDKQFDLRSGGVTVRTGKRKSSVASTDEEQVLNSTYPSSTSLTNEGEPIRKMTKLLLPSSSSSDDSVIKSKAATKKSKKSVTVQETNDLSGYDSDQEEEKEKLDEVKTKKIKSKPEMNTPEEITRIEENVKQNDKLKTENK